MVAVTFEARDIVVGEIAPGTYLLCDFKPMTYSSQPWFPEKKKKKLHPTAWAARRCSLNEFFLWHSFTRGKLCLPTSGSH